MASNAKPQPPNTEPAPPFVIPDGITVEYRAGPVTGKPMFRVAGAEMPYMGSEEAAVGVYQRLHAAAQTRFFTAARK